MSGFPALLERQAERRPDVVAIRVDGGAALTYREWHERALGRARGLVAAGFAPGTRVGLRFDNASYVDYAVAYVAMLHSGAVAVPLARAAPGPEIERMSEQAGISVVVSGLEQLPAPVGAGASLPPPHPSDLAEILFTSGSTGMPKAVAVPHGNLAGEIALDRATHGARDRQLHAIPVATNWGQFALRAAISTGMSTVVMPAFDPERALELIERHRPTELLLVPAMARWLLPVARATVRDVRSLTRLRLSGAAIAPATLAQLRRTFPSAAIHVGYSSTEASPACTMMEFPGDPPDTVGRPPRGHEAQVVDPTGEPLPAGSVGEVRLRATATPARWYLNGEDPAVFDHGWVRTGDLGSIDADGYLRLRGRKADVIDVGGSSVHSSEVEAALLAHPAVMDAAAFGVPAEPLGEQVAVAVVLSTPVEPRALRRFAHERLAAHKVPTLIHVLDELPLNRSGKVSTPQLRRDLGRTRRQPSTPEELEHDLLGLWRELLDADELAVDDDLTEQGADSLTAFAVLARLEERSGVRVPPSRFIVLRTVNAQARLIAELLVA